LRRTFFGAVVFVVAAAATSGCAVGPVGLIAADIAPARGAWVADVYALGVHVRSPNDEVGASIGIARRSFLFENSAVPSPPAGWHLLIVPSLPYETAIVRDLETFGIDLRLDRREIGFTIGIFRLTGSRPEAAGEALFRDVTYVPRNPRLTCVVTTWEERC